jgi:glutamine amidotransferase
MITIVDYGMGNLGSIRNMLKKVGAACEISADPDVVRSAGKLILPGVGAFDAGMSRLEASGLADALHHAVKARRAPVLGICLGMQLMTRGSEEGQRPGLGWIDATSVRFKPSPDAGLKVPHMGWNVVTPCKLSALVEDAPEEERFYFVHSYYVRCASAADVLLRAAHGETFDAAFERENVLGVQFHPEKSHRFGLQLLRNFARNY